MTKTKNKMGISPGILLLFLPMLLANVLHEHLKRDPLADLMQYKEEILKDDTNTRLLDDVSKNLLEDKNEDLFVGVIAKFFTEASEEEKNAPSVSKKMQLFVKYCTKYMFGNKGQKLFGQACQKSLVDEGKMPSKDVCQTLYADQGATIAEDVCSKFLENGNKVKAKGTSGLFDDKLKEEDNWGEPLLADLKDEDKVKSKDTLDRGLFEDKVKDPWEEELFADTLKDEDSFGQNKFVDKVSKDTLGQGLFEDKVKRKDPWDEPLFRAELFPDTLKDEDTFGRGLFEDKVKSKDTLGQGLFEDNFKSKDTLGQGLFEDKFKNKDTLGQGLFEDKLKNKDTLGQGLFEDKLKNKDTLKRGLFEDKLDDDVFEDDDSLEQQKFGNDVDAACESSLVTCEKASKNPMTPTAWKEICRKLLAVCEKKLNGECYKDGENECQKLLDDVGGQLTEEFPQFMSAQKQKLREIEALQEKEPLESRIHNFLHQNSKKDAVESLIPIGNAGQTFSRSHRLKDTLKTRLSG